MGVVEVVEVCGWMERGGERRRGGRGERRRGGRESIVEILAPKSRFKLVFDCKQLFFSILLHTHSHPHILAIMIMTWSWSTHTPLHNRIPPPPLSQGWRLGAM